MSNTDVKATGLSNIPEFAVGDLALSLKKTLEDNYGRVRVRGELSRVTLHSSGHMYSTLKDDRANIDAVCWKGTVARLSIRPEEGLEVICTGRITTYPASSKYQLVIESMELAGEGALLKMLEDRRKRLAAEGLFADGRKKRIPFLPHTIGVITSPTGAVIRDIMHRLNDRFPVPVLLWPVRVQGETAAAEVVRAIEGFSRMQGKPDVIILARGGGSLEDLMPFNDEAVVRAIAACPIPVISAIGHETDTSLADHAADLRAPTPTGAAEMAVPRRADLFYTVQEFMQRLHRALSRSSIERRHKVESLTARLGDPNRILELRAQKLDYTSHRLVSALLKSRNHASETLGRISGRLQKPDHYLSLKRRALENTSQSLYRQAEKSVSRKRERFLHTAARLRSPQMLIRERAARLPDLEKRLVLAIQKSLGRKQENLAAHTRILESLSTERVLERGFVLVHDDDGQLITDADQVHAMQKLSLAFRDKKTVKVTAN